MMRILLADDHNLMREGLRLLIEKQADFLVVAETSNGREAIPLAKSTNPDVAIMDVTMPDMNGIEATYQMREACPRTKVIALSMHTDRNYVSRMLYAGASGYLTKDCACEELISAIRSVAAGHTYLSPRIAGVVVDDYVRQKTTHTAGYSLTKREREVLKLLTDGLSTKAIAEQLDISIRTVETHRTNIMHKANAYSLAELTKYAVREGLSSIEP
jgi:DNA-binding NarL/FixJ family response regulator